jgi:AcrR family transcriptional regulator
MPRGRTTDSDGDRRGQLLELGLKLFGERSYAEISIDEIAKAARISRGLLYHYFKNKRGFYTETVRHAAEQLVARVQSDDTLEPEQRTRAGVHAYLDYVERYAGAYVVLLRGGLGVDEHVRTILEGAREAIVDRMIADGPELERTPAVHAALRGWLHLVEGMSLDWLERREIPRATLVEILSHALWSIVENAVELDPARSPSPDS